MHCISLEKKTELKSLEKILVGTNEKVTLNIRSSWKNDISC